MLLKLLIYTSLLGCAGEPGPLDGSNTFRFTGFYCSEGLCLSTLKPVVCNKYKDFDLLVYDQEIGFVEMDGFREIYPDRVYFIIEFQFNDEVILNYRNGCQRLFERVDK